MTLMISSLLRILPSIAKKVQLRLFCALNLDGVVSTLGGAHYAHALVMDGIQPQGSYYSISSTRSALVMFN